MNIQIYVKQVVEIPDDKLRVLVLAVRRQWKLDKSSSIHAEDLLRAAAALGIVSLPDGYTAEDTEWEQTELLEREKATR